MEKFRYSAVDETGRKVSGTEEAATRAAAHLALLERGLESVEVTEKKSGSDAAPEGGMAWRRSSTAQ